jgi:hypothetical protein
LARVACDAAVRIHDGYLAAIFPLKRIFRQQPVQHLLGAQAFAEQVDSFRTVTDIHICLRGYGADSCECPRNHRPDGKIARGHRDTLITIRGINGHNGKRRNRWHLQDWMIVAEQWRRKHQQHTCSEKTLHDSPAQKKCLTTSRLTVRFSTQRLILLIRRTPFKQRTF